MSHRTHHRGAALLRAQLALCSLALWLLLPLASEARKQGNPNPTRPTHVPVASPTPQPTPPTIEFQASTDRESAERGQEIHISLFVSNKSAIAVTGLKLNFADKNFQKVVDPAFPASLAPFDSITDAAVIKPLDGAVYDNHKLLFSIEYNWKSNGTEFHSAQPAIAAVLVKRRFEEETKGFPGGTAAFFYLLLPIIPAILSYQFFDGLRKGEGAKLPSFSAEYVVPAFFAAVVLSLLMLFAFKLDSGLNYSNPVVFTGVLFGSLVFGAARPLWRWRHETQLKELWGFNNADTAETYLRKALLAPWSPREFTWARGKVDDDQWEGILLKQPNGVNVLGARLQVSYPTKPTADQWTSFLKEVIRADGFVVDRRRLVEMVESKELGLGFDTRIKHDGSNIDQVVVIDEVKNWKRAGDETSPLVNPFS